MSDWEKFDYEARIKTRPTEYLQRDKDKQIPNIFAAFASPLNELEEVNERIYLSQSIYNSNGVDLDRFGEYVGLPRGRMGDDDYRQEILRLKFTLAGSGTDADIFKLAQAVTNFADVILIEHEPASYVVHLSGPSIPKSINKVLDKASVGGVSASVTHDYGSGAFALAGIDKRSGEALQVGESTALQAGDDTEIMGLNRGQVFIRGSRLASTRNITSSGGSLAVNDDILADSDANAFYVGNSASMLESNKSSRLAGAMPKGEK